MRPLLKLMGGLAATVAVGAAVGIAAAQAATAPERPLVEWGGTTHTTQESLEAWLAERGLSYDAWAYQHPIAALRLDQAKERAERTSASPAPVSSPAPAPRRPVDSSLLLGVGALGLVLALVAGVLSVADVRFRFRRSLRFATERRAYVGLSGVACVAVAAASYAVQFY
jgi:hypothetical protein